MTGMKKSRRNLLCGALVFAALLPGCAPMRSILADAPAASAVSARKTADPSHEKARLRALALADMGCYRMAARSLSATGEFDALRVEILDQGYRAYIRKAREEFSSGRRREALFDLGQARLHRDTPEARALERDILSVDYSWLGSSAREDYTYRVVWEPVDIRSNIPREMCAYEIIPEAERGRIEQLIFEYARLYPPEYLNTVVGDILCYKKLYTPTVDADNELERDLYGNLILSRRFGSVSEGKLIITDGFKSDYAFIRALVHETAHMEFDYLEAQRAAARTLFYASLFRENPDFFRYADDANAAPSDDFQSTDIKSDWESGFARSYGTLSPQEDAATLTEKVVLGQADAFGDYAALDQKLRLTSDFRNLLSPYFTVEFFTRLLPGHLKTRPWFSPPPPG